MKRTVIALILAFPKIAFAGDSLYFSIGPIGIGEISNRILLYVGDDFIRTPIPATKEAFALGVSLAIGLFAVSAWRMRTKKT